MLDLGIQGLIEKLRTNTEKGLTPIDFKERDEHFGSNYKEPARRTPFCTLFFGALDDFMLKLLLVCALISISIDMGFADPHERSHGNNIFQISFINNFKYSLDRRNRYLCCRIRRRISRILE